MYYLIQISLFRDEPMRTSRFRLIFMSKRHPTFKNLLLHFCKYTLYCMLYIALLNPALPTLKIRQHIGSNSGTWLYKVYKFYRVQGMAMLRVSLLKTMGHPVYVGRKKPSAPSGHDLRACRCCISSQGANPSQSYFFKATSASYKIKLTPFI